MVSPTTQTKTRRYNRDQKLGVKRKRIANRNGTPSFPLDPESGITSNAPARSNSSAGQSTSASRAASRSE